MSEPEPAARVRWEPEPVAGSIFRLPLPMPDGTPVNVYLVSTPDGPCLVDTGFPSAECRETLLGQLASLGHEPADLRAILITHADVDHVGLAAELAEASGAPVLVHPLELDRGRLWRGDDAWLGRHGLPPSEPPRHAWPLPSVPAAHVLVADGETLGWGEHELRLVWCPGHTPGLLCAFDAAHGLLFTADHVLGRAPSPVAVFEAGEADPAGDYLRSLERVAGLDAGLALPGHGRAFGDWPARVAAVREERLAELAAARAAVAEGGVTAWEVTEALGFARSERVRSAGPYAARVALCSTLALLRHLEATGEIQVEDRGDRILFRPAAPAAPAAG